tara:strand:- start:8 stop:1030 length:1023 start_codon:yes stop_codon:yes gene_type:complete
MAYISFQPSDFFNTKLYTGTGASNAVTGVGFQPDFTWIKNRDVTDFHVLTDVARGVTKYIKSDDTTAETTNAESLKSFDSDGFTVGNMNEVNTNTEDYASWNWKAGTTSGLTGGTITPSSYSINTTSGFGMYKYVGNTTSGATIAHGLGVIPKFIMVKSTDQTSNWQLQHVSTGPTKYLELNSNIAAGTSTSRWNDTAPTSTVFSLGNTNTVNDASYNYIAYVWADVKGYSKFSSYTGNAAVDGQFIYTGFRPAFVMIKRYNTTGNWTLWDSKRAGYNTNNAEFQPNLTSAEGTSDRFDLLSNGFKMRDSSPTINDGSYIYMAFAESPFVNSSGVPTNAR